jgi:inositol oxygenase
MAVAEKTSFRNYEATDVKAAVREHYRKMRRNQTYAYVRRMKSKYLTFDKPMHLWDAMEKLNDLIDVSDPDLDLPNVQHLIQSAEALRAENRPDWMQLVGLIHDLGKVMYLWGSDADGTSQQEQWGLVGDVFVVGCQLPDTCVYPEFNALNADMSDPRYNTALGIYSTGCGLDSLELAWGHDEYLYQVLRNHHSNAIPEAGMVMIRYHSFYPWHTGGSYSQFETDKDQQYKEWIRDFNQYDLYTKSQKVYDLNEVKDYYVPIAEKYLGNGNIMW